VGQRFQATTDKAMSRTRTKLIHERKYAAEISVELIEDNTAWSPYLTPLTCGGSTQPVGWVE
jgi:hypothetical protein